MHSCLQCCPARLLCWCSQLQCIGHHIGILSPTHPHQGEDRMSPRCAALCSTSMHDGFEVLVVLIPTAGPCLWAVVLAFGQLLSFFSCLLLHTHDIICGQPTTKEPQLWVSTNCGKCVMFACIDCSLVCSLSGLCQDVVHGRSCLSGGWQVEKAESEDSGNGAGSTLRLPVQSVGSCLLNSLILEGHRLTVQL